MLHRRHVVVVVPAHQEEAHIAGVIEQMPAFVDRVIVVDDGCRDRTADVARRAGGGDGGGERAPTTVLQHPSRRGVGAAIVTGYQAALALTQADADAIAVMAGDGQMHPDDLERVVAPVVRGDADYVKGSRFAEAGVRQAMGLPRWVGGRVFSALTSLAIGQSISDSQCGFTALSPKMASQLDLSDLWPSFGYPNDILGQLAARRARIAEVPVRPVYGNEISKLRLRHLPPIFFLVGRAAMRQMRPVASVSPSRAGAEGDAVSEAPSPSGGTVTRTEDGKRRDNAGAVPYHVE